MRSITQISQSPRSIDAQAVDRREVVSLESQTAVVELLNRSIWFYPTGNVIETFIARQKNDEIVLDGSSPTGLPQQWIFSKITANSFDWREIVSADQRASWHVTEHMWIERRPAKQTESSR